MSKQGEKIQIKHTYKAELTRKIMGRYFLTMLIFMVGIPALAVFAWYICSHFIWYENNPFWHIFIWIRDNLVMVVGTILVVGWVIITYYFMSKLLRYLDEVVLASEQLTVLPDTPIRLSEDMRDLQEELNQVREQAIRNAKLAKETEQRKNDMIVYLAHDLKTPLTSVIGYLTLLRDEKQISAELRDKYTGIALTKAERLEDLINEFFDITRFNLTAITLETERINLSRMMEQIASEFLPILEEKELSLALSIEPGVEIICDPDKMERVFDNLIRNAVNYSFADSEIALTLRRNDGKVQIRVCNAGKNIPQEKLDRIFEQFFRLDNSRASSSGGAGLGLAIAKEIVELHGGTISVQSADERIMFTVELPESLESNLSQSVFA